MSMSTIDVDLVGINGDNNGWCNIALDSVVVFAIVLMVITVVFVVEDSFIILLLIL